MICGTAAKHANPAKHIFIEDNKHDPGGRRVNRPEGGEQYG